MPRRSSGRECVPPETAQRASRDFIKAFYCLKKKLGMLGEFSDKKGTF